MKKRTKVHVPFDYGDKESFDFIVQSQPIKRYTLKIYMDNGKIRPTHKTKRTEKTTIKMMELSKNKTIIDTFSISFHIYPNSSKARNERQWKNYITLPKNVYT